MNMNVFACALILFISTQAKFYSNHVYGLLYLKYIYHSFILGFVGIGQENTLENVRNNT